MAACRYGQALLFRHHPLKKASTSSVVIAVRHHDPRADRPWFKQQQKEKFKEEKKTLVRKIYDKYGLEPAVAPPPRETFEFPDEFKKQEYDETHPLYKEKAVFMCVPNTNMQEGIPQALWLCKAKMMGDGKQLSEQTQHLAETVEIQDMENQVYKSILHTRLYDTEDKVINTLRFGIRQVESLLRISFVLGPTYPKLRERHMARNAHVTSMFKRGDDVISTMGDPHGFLLASKTPLAALATPDEVSATKDYELPSFYPLAPTIDLTVTNHYRDKEFTGFHHGAPFPHAHTLFICNKKIQKSHEYFISRAIMYTHAHAVTRAKLELKATDGEDLTEPLVVQCVASDGVRFTFIQFQLNTLNHASNDGIKNMVWIDRENLLFNDMYPQDIKIFRTPKNRKTRRSYIKQMKTRRDPLLGCQDLDVSVYKKFLATYLNGALTL